MAEIKPRPHVVIVRFIFESGIKLEAQPLTIATASCIYHRFFQECNPKDYDQYLIAATALYLAGKAEEDHLKIRDVINVCYKTLHKNQGPLDLGETYWALRDSIVHTELLVLRVLKFQVDFTHPHKYLLHYVKSLLHWMDPEVAQKYPLLSTSWGFVQDLCHDPIYLTFKPQHIAIGAIHLALLCYGLQVPHSDDAVLNWYETFSEDLNKDKLWEIAESIIDVCNINVPLLAQGPSKSSEEKSSRRSRK